MSNRWKMNRIGFVNFWLYDEEDFSFEDGKLLLRGQNGSGKSITTQSFIPFVLDGDRTPSRLDPFGSSDRRMEYYFLGEEGKEESTGYLYLEFKKEHSEEYRTIGIGQRAKRGKSMDFWGFVLLDGRRVGFDLWLYKEVGTTRIPLDKRELRNALGEGNFFTDSQSEYKKHVNQYIFGFRKEEQYEQFIRLLVKVRAPKLSKEFKPTKVYEILNDSLQTLTDEDLRAMVDAMEKMDEIQDSLEMLNRAFADVKIIRNEYTRYNQFMLARKAQSYLSKKQEVEHARQKLDELTEQKRGMEEEQRETRGLLEKLSERKTLAETERDGLMDTDMEEMDRKLEQAKLGKEEAERQEKRWSERMQECQSEIWQTEQQLRQNRELLEQQRQKLMEQRQELSEMQEVLQWEGHSLAMQLAGLEQYEGTEKITQDLTQYKARLEQAKRAIYQYAEISRQYDELACQLDLLKKEKQEKEQRLSAAQDQVVAGKDRWISGVFQMEKEAAEWHPRQERLQEAEQLMRQYQSVSDAGRVRALLHADYEEQRQKLTDLQHQCEYELRQQREVSRKLAEELHALEQQAELEPERDANAELSRKALQEAGIEAVPFYKAVEFAPDLGEAACARLEAQLQKTGLMDALVVTPEDAARIRQVCPEFLDTILYAESPGNSSFSRLVVNETLSERMKTAVSAVLSHFYEDGSAGEGIYLGQDGCFSHGLLTGKADKGSAEFVGQLARKRKKEEKLRQLRERMAELEEITKERERELSHIGGRMVHLQEEYQSLPDFAEIDEALAAEKEQQLELQLLEREFAARESQENACRMRRDQQYQVMLQQCKPFPYGRTEAEYDEVCGQMEEYQQTWQEVRDSLHRIESERSECLVREEKIEQSEQLLDESIGEKRRYSTSGKAFEIQIRQLEEYLNRPENREKARRLQELREELRGIEAELTQGRDRLSRLDERLRALIEAEPRQREELQQAIAEETDLRGYFEEELSLKLVLEREGKTLAECARQAVGMLRDSDKNREPGELLQSLYQVYQRHNGSLASYGTSLEDCFETAEHRGGAGEAVPVLRKRVRVVSVWNGKKVYLEEFYQIIKASIEETELLIQKKDRELFEDILSQTISQQLTDRIAESRRWVKDMSLLMKEMDTSMGLHFSLDWKPRAAENEAELDTLELEQILLRDRALLTMDDIEKVASHFRSKIRTEKQKLEESGGVINYMELVRDALDYRKWFEFRMFYQRGEEGKKPLSNAAFNRFSGGEKAMAMYVPLFAAVNAQYQKATYEDHPRMIALDEAFAGVDDKNISSMFELVEKLDFDYIMNSQALWGCYETVHGLRIAELLRPLNSQIVSVIRYTWNGHERILDEQ